MMKTRNSILITATLFCLQAQAQTWKADSLFEKWEYYRAAQIYQKSAKKHPSPDVYYKLGECYRKMNRYTDEEVAFDKVNAAGNYYKPEFYLKYGEVLKNNGKYDQAKVAFDKYSQLMPSDPRGKFFSESIDVVNDDRKTDQPIKVSDVNALNSQSSDFSPVLYKEGIVFTSSRRSANHDKTYGWTGNGYLQLYYAKKSGSDTLFAEVTPFGGKVIDQKYHDGPACFSRNYDTIYTSRVEKDLKGKEKKILQVERNKIFSSTYKDSTWTQVVAFPLNNDTFSVANPFVTADGSTMYFVSDMPGGYGETDIYYCKREGSSWGKPVNMGPNINTFNREKFPVLASDSTFYFASDGYQGYGGLDICVALQKNGQYQKAIPMKYPFNSYTDDYGIMFLKDGKTGYISSNRYAGTVGDDDIFYFNLPNDAVDSSLVTSIYTIGYQPKPKPEVLVKNEDTLVEAQAFVAKKAGAGERNIYFDFDKYVIRPDAVPYLDSVVTFMKASPAVRLRLGGHCDNAGSPAYNMVLSNERDNAVIGYLSGKGISRRRIQAKGYGLTQMVNRCVPGVICSEEEQQANRRVTFSFDMDKDKKENIRDNKNRIAEGR
jgi:outer membrane protein OmpA-like peptidoglycan-associated protein/tetratricopeptide (TPR) repeat protein